jgi:hypothetical protein
LGYTQFFLHAFLIDWFDISASHLMIDFKDRRSDFITLVLIEDPSWLSNPFKQGFHINKNWNIYNHGTHGIHGIHGKSNLRAFLKSSVRMPVILAPEWGRQKDSIRTLFLRIAIAAVFHVFRVFRGLLFFAIFLLSSHIP